MRPLWTVNLNLLLSTQVVDNHDRSPVTTVGRQSTLGMTKKESIRMKARYLAQAYQKKQLLSINGIFVKGIWRWKGKCFVGSKYLR